MHHPPAGPARRHRDTRAPPPHRPGCAGTGPRAPARMRTGRAPGPGDRDAPRPRKNRGVVRRPCRP
ncbi:hypothetical protein SCATT_57910 [Streptantibioticus cattleyicolor NRRL 8057 = DSM 46488]|uniref:Uncharacterized protein n=1 Tax=Streptantibioticus cattleyicolor (strain ATCC 35852 / DSM 46488 / JCM 4925 / NBRC 14057 / NRRL 8057) TaxID=1003195 RepID=G8X1D5_STREN|nr:hypothetical protein SCATT_57910 [Streptantibioticus cattleyicolor NRRL 8057 = DSM 46488]